MMILLVLVGVVGCGVDVVGIGYSVYRLWGVDLVNCL